MWAEQPATFECVRSPSVQAVKPSRRPRCGSAFSQLAASGAAAFTFVQEIRTRAGRCWSQANR